MTIKNADAPAMPIPLNECDRFVECGIADGLTKREAMAMHMMSGLLSKPGHSLSESDIARDAVRATTALLMELEHTNMPAVSERWQLVPIEPTIEMIRAATHDSVCFGTKAVYQAMLAAAPKPKDE